MTNTEPNESGIARQPLPLYEQAGPRIRTHMMVVMMICATPNPMAMFEICVAPESEMRAKTENVKSIFITF